MHCEQPEVTDNNGNEVTHLFIDLLNYFMHKRSTCYDTLHCKISRKKNEAKWQRDLKGTRKLDGLMDQVSKNAIKSMVEETA